MDGLISSDFRACAKTTLRRGTLVDFVIPYATTLELVGRQRGMVLSLDMQNQNQRPLICPLMHGESPVNAALGIKIPTKSAIPSYLRPDLASHIGIDYGQVKAIPRGSDGQPCIAPRELIESAYRKFISIIEPSEEKLAQQKRGFLAYGEIGRTHGFPRSYESVNDPAPILNLTPPAIYQETGMALVVRAFSHLERFCDYYDIRVKTNRWFTEGFFPVTEIRVLPIKETLAKRIGWDPVPAGRKALKGFAKKAAGIIDADARDAVTARYPGQRGQLPPNSIVARSNIRQAHP